MLPSGSQKQKGLGFSGFSVQTKKPKDNALTQPVNKLLNTSSGRGLYRPEDKKESEMYNPFEPTSEPVELPRSKDQKLKKKRKSLVYIIPPWNSDIRQ